MNTILIISTQRGLPTGLFCGMLEPAMEVHHMDCRKTGQLIAQLRKEKAMTQQQLAQVLVLSPKTISKWETGGSLR